MVELTTRAEERAKKAQDLSAFRNINLLGLKNKVSELLELIGRVEGIFSTYTRHDITHADEMTRMLEWLVPPETQKIMSPVDWLLTVTSIYLHDLGMFVTGQEFRDRHDNPEYRQFLHGITTDLDGRDYLARVEEMSEEDRERFLYQEFIRHRHAERIREWITGRHSRNWGSGIGKIAEDVASLVGEFPTRFRENLAVVCESHHRQNLDDNVIYPLAQRYGNHRDEVANVQYAALLLRTADLLHVTKDRTPSVTYRYINFSDLRGVDEWKRQLGTFSVHMRSRTFAASDEETHVIEISADFSEERPFFALSEYVAWANRELTYTRECAAKSEQQVDGRGYSFPWKLIRGDIRVEGNEPRQMRFELDRGRLLNLLVGHTIYNDPTVAIRELLQNAIDAVRFRKYLVAKTSMHEEDGSVTVNWTASERLLAVSDGGTGMSLETIQSHLLRVGSSFYDTPQFQNANADFSPISRFGIGVLTCFMVSDDVEIVTCRDNKGWRIRMSQVQADYLLKELTLGDPLLEGVEPHGTRVTLKLRPTIDLNKRSVLDIVRHWVLLPECAVYYKDGERTETIGFESASHALRYLYTSDDDTASLKKYDFLTVRARDEGAADYELAFVVRHSFTPERVFAESHSGSAATCVEGIRADSNIPGFRDGLPALLSIRGNRRFRTTVSRSSLERDREYDSVAKICAKALFGHVEQEVERIASAAARPLSQASSTGRWVANSLLRVSEAETEGGLNQLLQRMPLVVVEEASHKHAGDVVSSRNLRSLAEVQCLESFWSIESRTVDYLNTISQDLGSDVGIMQFVSSLAPNLFDSRLTPLIPDWASFVEYLIRSHSVQVVEVSRRHQRTIMQWRRRESLLATAGFPEELREPINELKEDVNLRFALMRRYHDVDVERDLRMTHVLSVSGDGEGTDVVRSGDITVLDPSWSLAPLWETLANAYRDIRLAARERAVAGLGAVLVGRVGEKDARDNNLDGGWLLLREEVGRLLRKEHYEGNIPLQLTAVGTRVFAASEFWRDWTAAILE